MQDTKREQMREVHVRVRLSNAVDFMAAKEGRLDPGMVRSCEVDALVVPSLCYKRLLPSLHPMCVKREFFNPRAYMNRPLSRPSGLAASACFKVPLLQAEQ